MIRIKRRKVDDAGSSGSLNDLSFLLIVFFIVIAGFNVNKGFLMNLPEKDKPRVVNNQDLMKCTLNADGTMEIDGQKIDSKELEKRLAQMKSSFPNMTFLLLIDEDCPYQNVVDVIYSVRKNKIENFSFKTKGN